MENSQLFKALCDVDSAPIVICNLEHTIVYMNPVAVERYKKRGGADLVGRSILDCHNEKSGRIIKRVVEWFLKSKDNNIIYTFDNKKENKEIFMIALRDDDGNLIGYYEKHEYRNKCEMKIYDGINTD